MVLQRVDAGPKNKGLQPHCGMSGAAGWGGPGFPVITFFRAFLFLFLLVPFLQVFWQTQEAVS